MKHDRPEELRVQKEKKVKRLDKEKTAEDVVLEEFKQENSQAGIRVFVAGGSRSGNDEQYVEEAYKLGEKIIEMDFKLDFGLSNSGIMGAVARGVWDSWNQRKNKDQGYPIQGITTKKYFALYSNDEDLIAKMEVVVTRTLEERKKKLLKADYVVFTPGGVGTLDELAYDCVAMQDGMLPMKPFIIYNVNGYFHHLLEYLKFIAHEGFAEPVPFIVVDDAEEAEIAFRLLKQTCQRCSDNKEAYTIARKLVYELPYYIKKKIEHEQDVEVTLQYVNNIRENGTEEQRQILENDIEAAYLEREIEKMYGRLVQSGRDTGTVSDKLARLKKRHKEIK